MKGQWIRILDPLLMDELGWHRVRTIEVITTDVDSRSRVELCCHVAILVNPQTCERGLPGNGAVICTVCASWKEGDTAEQLLEKVAERFAGNATNYAEGNQ